MRKRAKLIGVLAILVLVFGIELVARYQGERDFDALVRGAPPVFAQDAAFLKDGGSTQYSGWGYTLTQMHRKWPRPVSTNQSDNWYRVGPELRYWLPLPGITPNKDGTFETNN